MSGPVKVEWDTRNGLPIPTERRDEWARDIAAGKSISRWSGDSIVFGQRDEDEIFIVDAQVRRTASVPIPEGYCDAVTLADALEALLSCIEGAIQVGELNTHNGNTADNGVDEGEVLWNRQLDAARAALRAAGRLP